MKVVISSFGSSGDFNPCLGIGRALFQKGVEVIFLSNPYYQQKITEAGLTFFPAGQYWDVFEEIRNNPDYLHPGRGPKKVWKLVLETSPVMYSAMTDLIDQHKPDMAACHLLEFGGMMAARSRKLPYTVLCPNPMSYFNQKQPGYFNFTEQSLWIRRVQARAMHGFMNAVFKYSLKPYCQRHSIPHAFDGIDQIFTNAALSLGLWSALLMESSKDDPPNSKLCGFVRDEHVCDWNDVPNKILDLFNGPAKPIVVGLGSAASLHGDTIYQHTAQVCAQLNRPCLLVGKNLAQYSRPEKNILAIDFAPYGWVFRRAAVVVHHGGLNTTAETLQAGVPGLVIPHGYDQFDNAIRTEQMGVSKRLRINRVASDDLLLILKNILDDNRMQARAKALADRLKTQPDGAMVAADAICEVITNRSG